MTIRKGLERDKAALKDLLGEFNMQSDIDIEDFLIAEEAGVVAGTVCLERIGDDVYLRAMAVHPNWQGKGVGSKLVKELVSGLDQIKVVARGSAVPFYRKLGFWQVEWSVIHKEISEECVECPDVITCKPLPMIYEKTTNSKITI